MAIATKRPMTAKIGMTKTGMAKTGMPKSGMNLSAGKNSRRNAVKPTILPDGDVPTDGAMADAVAADKMVDTITGTMDNAQQQDGPNDPAAQLVGMQMRTLADLCEALDKKCLELVEEVAAARAAASVSEPAIAKLNQTLAEERGFRAKLERELATAQRQQVAIEHELADLRLVHERSNRPGSVSRSSFPLPALANGEHAARILPLLEASLASGKITAVHDANRALARFRTAGMIDSIEGTRDAPFCLGWLLSRFDLQAEPLMFLMDDVGLLGWTEAKTDRQDVNEAYRNTKPRPGFKALLSRVPVGRLRGIVAIKEAGSDDAVFFEAAGKTVPKNAYFE